MRNPKSLEAKTKGNLELALKTLIQSGEEITVTDKALPFSIRLFLTLE
jgi:hypothetical protein